MATIFLRKRIKVAAGDYTFDNLLETVDEEKHKYSQPKFNRLLHFFYDREVQLEFINTFMSIRYYQSIQFIAMTILLGLLVYDVILNKAYFLSVMVFPVYLCHVIFRAFGFFLCFVFFIVYAFKSISSRLHVVEFLNVNLAVTLVAVLSAQASFDTNSSLIVCSMVMLYNSLRLPFLGFLVISLVSILVYGITHLFFYISFVNYVFNVSSLVIVCVIGLIQEFFSSLTQMQIFLRTRKLNHTKKYSQIERARGKKLLENIFPRQIIPLIVQKQEYVKHFDELTIIVLDIKSFTRFATIMGTRELIDLLHSFYSSVDQISLRYNVEKLYTAGDSFIGCSFATMENFPEKMVLAGFEMIETMQNLNKSQNLAEKVFELKVRIGISCTDAYLAIVSTLSFGCFGRGMDVAKMLEQSCLENRVQVCENIVEKLSVKGDGVKGKFRFTQNESTMAKNKPKGFHVTIMDDDEDDKSKSPFLRGAMSTIRDRFQLLDTTTSAKDGYGYGGKLKSKEEKVSTWMNYLLVFRNWGSYVQYLKETYSEKVHFARISFILILFIYAFVTVLLIVNRGFDLYHIILLGCVLFYVFFIVLFFILSKSYALGHILSYGNIILSVVFLFLLGTVSILTKDNEEVQDVSLATINILFPLIHFLMQTIHFYVQVAFSLVNFIYVLLLSFTISLTNIFSLVNVLPVIVMSIFGRYWFQHWSVINFQRKISLNYEIETLKTEITENKRILHKTLPKPILERLLSNNRLNFYDINDGCVLFCQISGLQFVGEKGNESIKVLDQLFTKFDALVKESKCYKVKNFEDLYLCVSGIYEKKTEKDNSHKRDLLNVAKEMVKHFVEEKSFADICSIRIGLHAGDFSAGVVGTSKFVFDVFGDVINCCYRLCENCVDNRTLCSKDFVKGLLDEWFEERGTIVLKGKGEVSTYFVK